MLKRRALAISVAVLYLVGYSAAHADVLTVGTRRHQGSFEGFEAGQFLFRTAAGQIIRQSRPTVRSLQCDAPRPVKLLRANRRDEETVNLLGYANARFAIEAKGCEESVFGMHVRSIELRWVPGNGRGREGRPKPARQIDLVALEARDDLTAEQARVLRRYRAARTKYDAFVAQSSALVSEMDRATGKRREDLLDSLRRRKDAEQPLKRDLEAATAALPAAFPDPPAEPDRKQNAEAHQPAGAERTEVPKVGADEVLLIDVSDLRGSSLTREQELAVRNYEAATRQYADAAPDKERAAIAELKQAQTGLLKAFPGLKIAQ